MSCVDHRWVEVETNVEFFRYCVNNECHRTEQWINNNWAPSDKNLFR